MWLANIALVWLLLISSVKATVRSSSNDEGGVWSEWSECSRSCDGGIARRYHCSNANADPCPPSGHPLGTSKSQHKICNMHPCQGPMNFRQEKCVQHNDVLHEGRSYHWESFIHQSRPCEAWCRASEDPEVEIRLDGMVVDGTRCSSEALHVCMDGQCQAVGCDLMVGSNKTVDSCGICGGNNSCQKTFAWTEVALSHCSRPCGGGYRMARSVCQNTITTETVEDDFCNRSEKPDSRMAPCNDHPCPARWEVEDWQPCSQSCGGGFRSRVVKCIIDKDGEKVLVSEEKCPDLKPLPRESCNIDNCPQWYTGIWSECNVKCGQGLQHRNVICRDGSGHPSPSCDFAVKPVTRQPCTGQICDEAEEDVRQKKTATLEENEEEVGNGWMKINSGILKPPKVGNTQRPFDNTENTTNTMKEAISAEPATTTKPRIPSEPTFIVEEWGPCSSPCGEGIRERQVQCKIFLEFSKTVAVLPDHECPGPKPPMTEICFSGLCQEGANGMLMPPVTSPLKSPLIHNVQKDVPHHRLDLDANNLEDNAIYQWKDVGFTACSESCLGGLQESKIICINDRDDPVSPMHCDMSERPEVIVQTCNDHPCPPRWNVSEFSSCSKSCGGGIQTRSVTCIQEVRHGGNNILRVDDSFCPQPPPITQQFCSVVDCPVEWKTGPWSKCSKKCGGGYKVRDVICQQSLALGELTNKPDRDCPLEKPNFKKACNAQPCLFSDTSNTVLELEDKRGRGSNPLIKANVNQIYEQTNPNQHTVRLKIGGQATVFKGTKLKIRCPVKKFNRSAIQWAKGEQLIPRNNGKRSKARKREVGTKAFVTRKGSLRIPGIGYQEAGIYSCMAEGSTAKINIIVKPRDSNEVLTQNTNDFSKNSWDYEKNSIYGVVKHSSAASDYSFGVVPVPDGSQPWNNDHDLHMRFNEVEKTETNKNSQQSEHSYGTFNGITEDGANNHLRFNEVENEESEDQDIHTWRNNNDYIDNTIHWSPYGDVSDYPNNQAKSKDLLTNNLLNGDSGVGVSSSSGSSACRVPFSPLLLIILAVLIKVTFGMTWNKRNLDYVDDESTSTEDNKSGNELELEWTLSEWSKCSHTCENGTQVRTVECTLIRNGNAEIIPYQFCVDSGLPPPPAIQSCGLTSCPQWTTQSWTPCHQSKCIAKHTGFQTRDVLCSVADTTKKAVEDKYCETVLRPRSSKTCFNRKCKGIWKTDQWSKCSVSCGVGQKNRTVECVWKHTGEPAGDACRFRKKPDAIKQCTTMQQCTVSPPLSKEKEACSDSSKYCGLIVSFKMCHKDKYKSLCCSSCKKTTKA